MARLGVPSLANLLSVLLLIGLGAMSAIVTWFVLHHNSDVPPVEYFGARLMSPEPVRAGGEVVLEYRQKRTRVCPADIYGWWVDLDFNTADVRLPLVHGGYSPVRETEYWQAVKLVAPPRPGNWQYRAQLVHFCPNGTYVTVPPPVTIEVK